MAMFYAVAKGRKTGVFSTWYRFYIFYNNSITLIIILRAGNFLHFWFREECEAHVDDFPGALFQKFDSKEKAETFLKDAESKKILYVVARGNIPGIYWEW